MKEVHLILDDHQRGSFQLTDDGQKAGEMDISISGKNLTVYHTEILPEWEGQGLSKKLLEAMVSHARQNDLKVTPLCTFVLSQFQRNPAEYADVWNKAGSK